MAKSKKYSFSLPAHWEVIFQQYRHSDELVCGEWHPTYVSVIRRSMRVLSFVHPEIKTVEQLYDLLRSDPNPHPDYPMYFNRHSLNEIEIEHGFKKAVR
jgi:hypothetical protein